MDTTAGTSAAREIALETMAASPAAVLITAVTMGLRANNPGAACRRLHTVRATFQGFAIQVPAKWQVKKEGPNLRVITGACSPRAAECRSFWLGGPGALKDASEGSPYHPSRPFHPSSGVELCVPAKKYFSGETRRVSTAKVPFGRGQRAQFTQWKVSCDGSTLNVTSYTQRIWYVKAKKVIVVDHWKTPGLGALGQGDQLVDAGVRAPGEEAEQPLGDDRAGLLLAGAGRQGAQVLLGDPAGEDLAGRLVVDQGVPHAGEGLYRRSRARSSRCRLAHRDRWCGPDGRVARG
ncbi:hypothetical protein [Nonomuraea dietziae]|uniref:hypothetical protein n=1 Tax=Nonomuraea dietziae TaxID=65515 RepID=UPI0033D5C62B